MGNSLEFLEWTLRISKINDRKKLMKSSYVWEKVMATGRRQTDATKYSEEFPKTNDFTVVCLDCLNHSLCGRPRHFQTSAVINCSWRRFVLKARVGMKLD